MVDAVIFHWVTLVAGYKAGTDEFGRTVQWLESFFYADDVLLNSPRPNRLQGALDVLTGVFNRVDLKTNINKTICMVC